MENEPSQNQPDGEQQGYLRVARFPGEQPAGHAYFQIQEAVLRSRRDNDLSAYRFRLNQVWHVAVLGDPPPETLARRLELILSTGESTPLPKQILTALKQRRAQAEGIGPWVEGHYRPARD